MSEGIKEGGGLRPSHARKSFVSGGGEPIGKEMASFKDAKQFLKMVP